MNCSTSSFGLAVVSFAHTDVFLFLFVGLLNFRIQIRTKLSCFTCLFRVCRRFFVVSVLLPSCAFLRAVGVVLKFFGVRGEIFLRFVLIAPEAFGR